MKIREQAFNLANTVADLEAERYTYLGALKIIQGIVSQTELTDVALRGMQQSVLDALKMVGVEAVPFVDPAFVRADETVTFKGIVRGGADKWNPATKKWESDKIHITTSDDGELVATKGQGSSIAFAVLRKDENDVLYVSSTNVSGPELMQLILYAKRVNQRERLV